ESHELNLADGLESLRRHADAQAADQKLGERRVDDPLRPEALLQPGGRTEHAAVDADILAEHDDVLVVRHRAGERQVDRLDERELRHRALAPAPPAGRRNPPAIPRRGDRTWFAAPAPALPDSARPPLRRAPGIRRRAAPPPPCPI